MAIKFTDKILDNVHGFIEYTNAEKAIMNTLLFKRLQSCRVDASVEHPANIQRLVC